eukprot:8965637-Lingulodinium_polyedra.AAC.1
MTQGAADSPCISIHCPHFFRVGNAIAVRLATAVHRVPKCSYADSSVLIHYSYDLDPDFHYYETDDIAVGITAITQRGHARIIQYLIRNGSSMFEDA